LGRIFFQYFKDVMSPWAIEAVVPFIKEQHRWLCDEGSAKEQAGHLSGGEAPHTPVEESRELQTLGCMDDALFQRRRGMREKWGAMGASGEGLAHGKLSGA